QPTGYPDTDLPQQALGFRVQLYGLDKHYKLFTRRQLATLMAFNDLAKEGREQVCKDATTAALPTGDPPIGGASRCITAYADAVATYLGMSASKSAAFLTSLARWRPGEGKSAPAFGRQAISMVWDFADVNPFAGAGGDFVGIVEGAAKALAGVP